MHSVATRQPRLRLRAKRNAVERHFHFRNGRVVGELEEAQVYSSLLSVDVNEEHC